MVQASEKSKTTRRSDSLGLDGELEWRLCDLVKVRVVVVLAADLRDVPRVDRQNGVAALLLPQVRVAEVVELKPGHGIAEFSMGAKCDN